MTTIGVLHPGEMGAGVAGALVGAGHDVLWTSAGRSAATEARAEREGLRDTGELRALLERSEVVLSLCPPSAAIAVAREAAGFGGVYVDANAIAPSSSRAVADVVERGGATYVDGGIIGSAPSGQDGPRLYLSGEQAANVAVLFAGTAVDASVISADPTAASALKMTYAAWTKGTAAVLLAIRAAARELGVEDALLSEWERSHPQLAARSERAAANAAAKGWRWSGEMEEIARTFAELGLPPDFHRAAARIFAAMPRETDAGEAEALETALARLRAPA